MFKVKILIEAAVDQLASLMLPNGCFIEYYCSFTVCTKNFPDGFGMKRWTVGGSNFCKTAGRVVSWVRWMKRTGLSRGAAALWGVMKMLNRLSVNSTFSVRLPVINPLSRHPHILPVREQTDGNSLPFHTSLARIQLAHYLHISISRWCPGYLACPPASWLVGEECGPGWQYSCVSYEPKRRWQGRENDAVTGGSKRGRETTRKDGGRGDAVAEDWNWRTETQAT